MEGVTEKYTDIMISSASFSLKNEQNSLKTYWSCSCKFNELLKYEHVRIHLTSVRRNLPTHSDILLTVRKNEGSLN